MCSAQKSGSSLSLSPCRRPLFANLTKSDPIGFRSESIFSPKDAAKGRNMLDSFFVGKISYYMVTPTTLLPRAKAETEKLLGVTGECKPWTKSVPKKLFFLDKALVVP